MSQIKKKWIGNKQVDGNKILLENNQPLKAKLQNGTEVDLFNLNAADEVEVLKAPRVAAEGTESNSLQTKSQVDAAIEVVDDKIDTEISDRIAADGQLQSQINAIMAGFDFKFGALLATVDADLAAAQEGDTLASVLPFSDDEGTQLVEADIAVGDMLLSKNGANSKAFRVYDDGGVKKLSLTGFTQIASGDGFLVKYDLPDSPATQETQAIYKFTGSDLVKIGDFDWAFADGIDISPAFGALSGVHSQVVAGDSVQEALHKHASSIAKLIQDLADVEAGAGGDIGDLEARVDVIEGQINTAVTGILAVQADHESRIDQIESDLNTATTGLKDVVASHESRLDAYDALNLDSRVDALEALDIGTRLTDVEGDVTTHTGQIADHESRITDLETFQTTIEGQNLDSRLDTIEAQNLNSRVSTLEGQNLDSRLDTIEGQNLNSRLTTAEGDIDNLETAIENLEAGVSANYNKVNHVVTSQNIIDGYVDLPHLIVANSMNMCVDRIPLHEGVSEDYTISTVSGVSRITFLNDLVSPSESALEAGDKLYIQYSYKPSEQP